MPRKFIRRYLPEHRKIRDHKHLQIFGTLLHDPNLWHLNRRSVSGAAAVGLFFAWVPVPFQMVLSAAVAIPARVNLPIAVVLVWVSNPFTMPPLFYFAYKLGVWLLGVTPQKFYFELSFDWLLNEMGQIWQPFLLGCFVMAVISSVSAFAFIRLLWRLHIVRYKINRRKKRFRK